MYDKYHNYQMAFYTAAGLALVALLCELKRPAVAERGFGGKERPSHGGLVFRKDVAVRLWMFHHTEAWKGFEGALNRARPLSQIR